MSTTFHIGCLPTQTMAECLHMGRLSEQLGYSGIWVADSHSIMRGAYEILAALAVQTNSLLLATGVTHTVTRHPAVLANSWASLQELSDGRAICGIGVGESAVHNLGLRPERLAVFEQKVAVLRALFNGQTVEYEGKEIRMPWSTRPVPIVMASSGPKSLQLAGRIADGVLFQVGSDPRLVQYALDNISKGAEAGGRQLEDLDLYMRIATAVDPDQDKARRAIKGYASVAAGTVFSTVPREYFDDQLYEDLTRMKAGYDYADHAKNESSHSDLLTDRIYDAISISCTPAEAIKRFNTLTKLGIKGFVWPAGMNDPYPYMESFAAEVIPHVNGNSNASSLQAGYD
jgi:5,10-methylenetetrahydromethanopterin reductase